VPEIEKEVKKFIEAGFICEVKDLTRIMNIVPVRKKNGQFHIYVDFGTSMKLVQKIIFRS